MSVRHPSRSTAASRASVLLALVSSVAMVVTGPPTSANGATAQETSDTADVSIDMRNHPDGDVADHFVGFSIEWSLIERYMGGNARPAFANLLGNLGGGVLRIGGSSQDQMRFDATAPNTNRVITPEDLRDIRSTLDAANAGDRRRGGTDWRAVLGTAMAPRTTTRPWIGPEHTREFVDEGVLPAFAGARQDVAGIELGNEPDLTYRQEVAPYLADFAAYRDSDATGPFSVITPATSEPIVPWQSIAGRSVPTRFFWDWPEVLDATAPTMRADAGPLGSWAADHFYPLARTCTSDPYRCPTIPTLLSDERRDNFSYGAYTHAREAAKHGVGYRLEEINTAAGRGAHGVSDVAASAVWALDTKFSAACPQPPHEPGANAGCGTGAVGVNFHNAELNAFYRPEEGNGYYNAVNFDPTPAMGAPTAAPEYYAMLLFSRFAQGTQGLRPLPVTDGAVKAWQLDGDDAERRLFLINNGDHPVALTVHAPASSYALHRMSPDDPAGQGRALDAPGMSIDGRRVSADGTWPGFDAATGRLQGGRLQTTLGTGEAVVLRLGGSR